jgi:hypothetical protein
MDDAVQIAFRVGFRSRDALGKRPAALVKKRIQRLQQITEMN